MTDRPLPTLAHGHAPGRQGVDTLPAALADHVAELARASKAENTRRAYAGDWHRWQAWCDRNGLWPLPASPEAVAAYLADHAGTLTVATLRRHLATISKAHQLAGHPSPIRSALVADVLAGLRRQHGTTPDAAPPLMADGLRATLAATAGTDPASIRDRAALLVGWCAALRRGELAALTWGSVIREADGASLMLAHSKTDKAGEGRRVPLPMQPDPTACPVQALEAWRRCLVATEGPEAVAPDMPILRRITAGRIAPAGLSGQAVAQLVQRRTTAAGLEGIRGHSLRVGLIWQAAQAGVPADAIMQTTGHRSLTMLRRYQREAALMQRAAARGLLA